METRLEQTAPVREFAAAIGEWLLERRFGTITPLAFRWRVWESYEESPLTKSSRISSARRTRADAAGRRTGTPLAHRPVRPA